MPVPPNLNNSPRAYAQDDFLNKVAGQLDGLSLFHNPAMPAEKSVPREEGPSMQDLAMSRGMSDEQSYNLKKR